MIIDGSHEGIQVRYRPFMIPGTVCFMEGSVCLADQKSKPLWRVWRLGSSKIIQKEKPD